MQRHRQCKADDAPERGQRHQCGLRAVVDKGRFATGAELADVPPHQAVNQVNERAGRNSGNSSTRTSSWTRKVSVVKAAAIR